MIQHEMIARYEGEDDKYRQSIYSSKHVAMPLARFGEGHIYRKVALRLGRLRV